MTDLAALDRRMRAWRRDLHAHPEVGFEEARTAGLVARELRALGLEVTEGVGGTGVVGSLRRGRSHRAIALRADMDALRITEATGLPHASTRSGRMHACGHDGHVAMLLGAAHLLVADAALEGTVHFLFQPAEEWGRGAQAMLDDGLLARFPFDEVYGLHNMPGLPTGHLSTCPGPIMAAEDVFEITLTGQGGHASAPHVGREVMVPACQLGLAVQTIVSRQIDPAETAVVSITEITTDGTRNALPGRAQLRGDARSFAPEVSARIEAALRRIADGIATQYGITARVDYAREFVATINTAEAARAMAEAARPVSTQVEAQARPISASEDFARFLAHVPGCFAFIGNGEGSAPLHAANYDFNDAALVHGAQVHAAIARARLAAEPST